MSTGTPEQTDLEARCMRAFESVERTLGEEQLREMLEPIEASFEEMVKMGGEVWIGGKRITAEDLA